MLSYSHIKCGVCGVCWEDHVTHDAAGNVVCVGRRPVDSTLTQAEADAAKANRDIHLTKEDADSDSTRSPVGVFPWFQVVEYRNVTSISTADIR